MAENKNNVDPKQEYINDLASRHNGDEKTFRDAATQIVNMVGYPEKAKSDNSRNK